MKKTGFLLFILTLLFSCKNELPPDNLGESSAQVTIGDKTYNVNFEANGTCNKNCDNLFVNFDNRKKGENNFGFRIHLKESGAINKIWYLGDEGVFETSYFDPYEHLKINNFKFDNKTNSLYFEFEGNLFSATMSQNEPLFVKGKINIPVLKDIECKNYYSNVLKLQNDHDRLLHRESSSIIDYVGTPQKSYRYIFNTDNGFLFTLHSTKSLSELPLGEYTFNNSSATNKVTIQKYIGTPDIRPSFHHTNWTDFDTAGTFTVTGKFQKNDYHISRGSITIKAYKDNVLKHSFENIYFEAVDIE